MVDYWGETTEIWGKRNGRIERGNGGGLHSIVLFSGLILGF